MSFTFKLLVLLLVVKCFQSTEGYGTGAPSEACSTMEPEHGPKPAISPPPFSVTPQQNNIQPGGTVKVLLEPKGRTTFQGFLIMAVNPADSSSPKALGRFINSPIEARSIDCFSGQSNALTHRNSKKKDKIEITWEAPSDYQGDIEFRCTFLRDFSTFWLQVPPSTIVRVGSAPVSSSAGGKSGGAPLVTLFDYFVWRIWFWTGSTDKK